MIHFKREEIHQYIILVLLIFFIFCLVLESYIELPLVLSWTGRLHPLILHFPIVLIIMSVLLLWTKRYRDIQRPVQLIATYTVLLTAITGLFLSLENETKASTLITHQWLGAGMAIAFTLLYWWEKKIRSLMGQRIVGSVFLIGIIITGHFGGMVTHGRDFLSLNISSSKNQASLPDDPIIYEHLVRPVLDEKCIACHNPDKPKGDLQLTNIHSMMEGGKSGSIIDIQDPLNSLLLHRIRLPITDEAHMPPDGKIQLTTDEKTLLEAWILEGADPTITRSNLDEDGVLKDLVTRMAPVEDQSSWDQLPAVSDKTIQKFNTNYCTVNRLFKESHALTVQLFPQKDYEPEHLLKLRKIKDNIVELDLSDLPLSEKEMTFAGSCTNLERLNINRTPVDDDMMKHIANLGHLEYFKAFGTDITSSSFQIFRNLGSLKKIYLSNIVIENAAVQQLRKENPQVQIELGIDSKIDFTSVLPVPVIEGRKRFFTESLTVNLSHPLEGINIHYTLDGTNPTDRSPEYDSGIVITHTGILKFQAVKKGWVSSNIDSAAFMQTIQPPDNYHLLNEADQEYKGGGTASLFDLVKGPMNFRDSTWMGFRNEPFELVCVWEHPISPASVTLSSITATGPHIFPPVSISVHGGMDSLNLDLLGTTMPEMPGRQQAVQFRYHHCSVQQTPVKYLKITATPVYSLPVWHPAKGQKGWFFIDEVLLSEKKHTLVRTNP